jgi:hypothetical protein
VSTPFAAIMKAAVERTPRAIGGAFAAYDGEMVDYWIATEKATSDPTEWAILTAHYGVILTQLESALRLWHFGDPQFFVVEHARLDVLVHAVADGYYALLAVEQPCPLWTALASIQEAARELKKEMFG